MPLRLLGPFLLFLCATALAQVSTTGTSPQRDAAAIAQVQVALQAMGGTDAIGAVQDCVASGSMLPAPGNPQTPGAFTWKHTSREFRYESPDRNGGTKLFVSGHGKPTVISPDGTVRRFDGYIARAAIAPHLVAQTLLQALNNPRLSFALDAPATVGGRSAVRVRVWNDSTPGLRTITAQMWYFDAITGLPLRLETKHPEGRNSLETHDGAVEFADFRRVSGTLVPFQFIAYVDGNLFSATKLDSVAFNTGLSTSEFDAPAEVTQ